MHSLSISSRLASFLDFAFPLIADVKDVGYVIVRDSFFVGILLSNLLFQNYDFPNNCEDYIHRIGRTGVSPNLVNDDCLSSLQRAGMKGMSYTFFTTENAKSARELLSILREAKATVPSQLEEMAIFGGGNNRSKKQPPSFETAHGDSGRYGGGGRGRGGGGRGRDNGYGSRDNGYGGRGGGGGRSDRW